MRDSTPAQKKLGFQIHAFCFAIGTPVLAAIDLWTGPPFWVQWVLIGWGIGLLAHWLFGGGRAPDLVPNSH